MPPKGSKLLNQHRCVNCHLKLNYNKHFLVEELNSNLRDLLKCWIFEDFLEPTEITDTGHLCSECHSLLLQAWEQPEKLRTRQLGHALVCVVCGCSLLRTRKVAVFRPGRSQEEWRLTAKVAATLLENRKLSANDQACCACWRKIDRTCQKISPKPEALEQSVGDDPEPIKTRVRRKPKRYSSPEPDSVLLSDVKVEMPDPLGDVDCSFKIETHEEEVYIPNEDVNVKIEYDYNESLEVNELQSSHEVDNLELKQDVINELYANKNLIAETNNLLTEIQKKITEKKEEERRIKTNVATDEKDEPGTIILPSLRRAASTCAYCIFKNCKNSTRRHISQHLRAKVLRKYNYFIPAGCRICVEHLEQDSFEELYDSRNSMKLFTAAHVEEMVALLVPQTNEHVMDYEHARQMPEYLLEYWTGIPNEMFMKILHITGLWDQDSMYLVALLCKLRTEDSSERMAKLFQTNRTNLRKKFAEVRKALIDNGECINMIQSTFRNKHRMKVFTQFFSDEPRITEEERAINKRKAERRKLKSAALAAAKESGTTLPKRFSIKTYKKLIKSNPTLLKKLGTSYSHVLDPSISSHIDTESSLHEQSSSLDQSETSTQRNTLDESNVASTEPVIQSVKSPTVTCTSVEGPWNDQPDSIETPSVKQTNAQTSQTAWSAPPRSTYESNTYVNRPTLSHQWNTTPFELSKHSAPMFNQWSSNEVQPLPSEINIAKTSLLEAEFSKPKTCEKRSFDDTISLTYVDNSATGSLNTLVITERSHPSTETPNQFEISSSLITASSTTGTKPTLYVPSTSAVCDIAPKRKRGRPPKRRDFHIT